MVQAICNGWISASGVSIYLLHHAVRDQRVGAGRADHNHDLGGGSIEDLGLVQGDRWGRPRHRWGWPVRVVDQGGSAQDLDLGGGSGGPGHGTPQAFNSAVDLPRARLGRRQRSIGPGRAVDQGGSARDVGLGGGSVEDLGMNASTLERIRFAAANRLCVDVGYEGDVQRVEPYSLRKARGGNVVLYACEAGSSECATYRTGGISEVEVTRQTFVPKYANELLSPGR